MPRNPVMVAERQGGTTEDRIKFEARIQSDQNDRRCWTDAKLKRATTSEANPKDTESRASDDWLLLERPVN